MLATTPVLAASAFVQLISTHNAMHSPLFHERRLNRAWQWVLSISIGYPVSIYVPVHNLSHHLGLQTPRDVLRTTEVRHRCNLLNLLHHIGDGHCAPARVAHRLPCTRTQDATEMVRAGRLGGSSGGGVFTAIALVIGPLAPMIALVLLPAVIGQWLMVGFGYVQHDGCDPESAYDHSRNFRSPIFNWFICDNGYHTAHHNRPGLHWSLARAAHVADVVPHMHPALDERSLGRYLWRTFMWPGRRVRYDGKAVELPAERTRRQLWTPASAIVTGTSSAAEG